MYKKSFLSLSAFCLITSSLSYAQENNSLDDLLTQYRNESDLSKETKKESAGSIIVYTRERLEKMQAYNLRDILKTIPILTMQETEVGQVSLSRAKGTTFNTQFLKLYINDHEVGSIGFGSAMKMWGYLDLAFVDHIEVYQVGSSVMAGDEPPGIVIRLYSKDPSRDNGSALQTMGGSRGSNETSAYYAYKGEKYSALVYGDLHNENRKNYMSDRSSTPVDRDFDTTNLFLSLSGDDFSVDAEQFTLKQDRLLGFGTRHTPNDNISDMIHRYVTATKYFQNRTLKVKLAYDYSNHKQSEADDNNLSIYNANGTKTNYTTWYYDKSESILDAVIEKQVALENHDLKVGFQTKRKEVISNSLLTGGVERVNEISGPDQWNSYSIFASDDTTLNENHLLFSNLKFDHSDLNNGGKDFNDYILRLGHIYNDGVWMWKTFGTRAYGYPVYMQTSYFPNVHKSDPNLKNESRFAVSTEIAYKTEASETNFRIMYSTARDMIALQNNAYINSTAKPDFYALYAGHEYNFDTNHRIHISGYYGDDDMPLTQSSTTGALVQLFDTFGQFDLFNELIYRKGYTYSTQSTTPQTVRVDNGYDYTVGITYHATKDLTIFIKGENLLNKAIKTPYPMATYVDYISPFDRTLRCGLKYVF